MKIEYMKPWCIKPKLNQNNLLSGKSFTLTISFKVGKDYKKDRKYGFLGIPGKNFGISFDNEVDKFVLEYWTIINETENQFNCHKNYNITSEDIQNGLTITIIYDLKKLKLELYNNFKLLDSIKLNGKLVNDYFNEPIFLGCHNPVAVEISHKCFSEMDVDHLSIFEEVISIKDLIKFHKGEDTTIKNQKLICDINFEETDGKILNDVSNQSNNIEPFDIDKESWFQDFNDTKKKLDSVGCGFCLAKWTQVTMHLHNGTTHSCHHPEAHKVGLDEIKRNPTALHNSKLKKLARREMLEDKRPSECNYCWKVEDNSDSFSDRVFKSSEPWSDPYFDEIKGLDWREDYNPKYVEVNFSNTCNFKCAYCGPEYSTKWMEEINEFGAYNLSYEYNGTKRMEERNTKPYRQTEDNPYVEAFWEWFPDLYNSLDTFRITGGEPLLSKDTWKVLDFIIETETPNKELKLSINSNLGVGDDLIDKLILKLERIISEGRVKEVIIFTSCEGYGKQAEYTRYGLEFNRLFSNIDKILMILDRVTIVVMSTFNIFSVFSYEKLIKKIYDLKLKHFNTKRYWNSSIILDTSYLRYPSFLSFRLLKDYIGEEYFDRWIKFMKFNSTYRSLTSFEQQTIDDVGFSTKEIEKVKRIKDIFVSDYLVDESTFDQDKKDLLKFIKEYEIRRGMNCEEYYPELKKFIKNIERENKL
jgi:hypothetical protein